HCGIRPASRRQDHAARTGRVNGMALVRLVVCVITFRRPEGLARLLRAMAAQRFTPGLECRLRMMVVDNDPAGSARAICDDARGWLPVPLDYEVEPRPGIPLARNRCLDRVGADEDALVFIDDDEWPATDWLDELVAAWRRFGTEAVHGPALPILPD